MARPKKKKKGIFCCFLFAIENVSSQLWSKGSPRVTPFKWSGSDSGPFPWVNRRAQGSPEVLWQRATAYTGSNSLKRLQMETESLPKLAYKEATVKLPRREKWQETGVVKDLLINYAPILKKKSVSINHSEENLEAEKSSGRESRHRVTHLQITSCGKPSLISKRSEWS